MSRQNDTWSGYAFRIVINAASHPFEYAKILIQIGHEPIAPRPTTTLLGKPALKLPNIFEYVKYIKSVDGISGCYRGLAPKLCGNMVGTLASQKVIEVLQLEKEERVHNTVSTVTEDQDGTTIKRCASDDEITEKELLIKNLRKDIICRFTTIVVSHPFHVITIRMMAQFVGGESKYDGVLQSIAVIYRQNGLGGFFSGLVPRILGEVSSLILSAALAYAVNNYVFQDKELHSYMNATMMFIASAITYPFQVVANCMAVTNSGLVAGSPPYMPEYQSWMSCWNHLSQTNQLKRGSSILIRYYVGPAHKNQFAGGKAQILPKNQIATYSY